MTHLLGVAGRGRPASVMGGFWTSAQGPCRWGRGPLPVSVGGPVWDRRRLAPAGWVPARSRAGIQAFSRESPDAKSRGGWPPAPPSLGPARSHSLVLAWWGAAGRSLGDYEAHLRALIWMRILREQGLGEKAFRCGGVPPAKASPWGEAVTEGDG